MNSSRQNSARKSPTDPSLSSIDFIQNFANDLNSYIQNYVQRAVQQETAPLRAEIENLKAHINAMEVDLRHPRRFNAIPPKGELFGVNIVKHIKLEDEDDSNFVAGETIFGGAQNKDFVEDEETLEDEEEEGEELAVGTEDLEDYEPSPRVQPKKRSKRGNITSQAAAKNKRWRARVDDVIFDDTKIGQFHYEYDGRRFNLTTMVQEKAPNSFTNTAITSAAKDITKYFLSMIIGDAHLHLYTSSSRTRRSYEPIPVDLQNAIKELVLSGAVSYSTFDGEELKKCIANAVETAIYDKCSYARKHPEKRARLEE